MYCIKQNKFHTIALVKRYIKPFEAKETTIASLLAICMSLSNSKYRTSQEYSEFIETQYGLSPSVYIMSYGDYMTLNISMLAINPKFIQDSSYTIQLIKDTFQLNELHPNVVNDAFDEETFLAAKNELDNQILHYHDNKQSFATKKAMTNFLNEDFASLFGECDRDELYKITPQELYRYYQEFMKYPAVFYCDGDIEESDYQELFQEPYEIPTYLTRKVRENTNEQEEIEYKKVDQMYLRVFYDGAPYYTSPKETIHMMVANYILGGPPTSKLFRNLREEKGLCYDVSSTYFQSYGFIMISLGIEPEKKDEALTEIDKVIESIGNGDITTDEFANLKQNLINGLKTSMDHRNFAIGEQFMMDTFLDRKISAKERIKYIKETTIDDVKKVFVPLHRQYIYALTGGEENV